MNTNTTIDEAAIAATVRSAFTDEAGHNFKLGMNPYLAYFCDACDALPGDPCLNTGRWLGDGRKPQRSQAMGSGCYHDARQLDARYNPETYRALYRECRNFHQAVIKAKRAASPRLRLAGCDECGRPCAPDRALCLRCEDY